MCRPSARRGAHGLMGPNSIHLGRLYCVKTITGIRKSFIRQFTYPLRQIRRICGPDLIIRFPGSGDRKISSKLCHINYTYCVPTNPLCGTNCFRWMCFVRKYILTRGLAKELPKMINTERPSCLYLIDGKFQKQIWILSIVQWLSPYPHAKSMQKTPQMRLNTFPTCFSKAS